MALFLAYYAYKNPTSILWGILLAWNILGIFDLFGAIVLTFIVPYQPLPEIGLNEIGVPEDSYKRIAKKSMLDQAYGQNPKKATLEEVEQLTLKSIKKAR